MYRFLPSRGSDRFAELNSGEHRRSPESAFKSERLDSGFDSALKAEKSDSVSIKFKVFGHNSDNSSYHHSRKSHLKFRN